MGIPLSQLDRAAVTVELDVVGRVVSLQGPARYERRASGSNRLHVDVADPAGPFTIVIDEDSWSGTITREPDGSGYRIRLNSPSA